jgi:hypothetical protein
MYLCYSRALLRICQIISQNNFLIFYQLSLADTEVFSALVDLEVETAGQVCYVRLQVSLLQRSPDVRVAVVLEWVQVHPERKKKLLLKYDPNIS